MYSLHRSDVLDRQCRIQVGHRAENIGDKVHRIPVRPQRQSQRDVRDRNSRPGVQIVDEELRLDIVPDESTLLTYIAYHADDSRGPCRPEREVATDRGFRKEPSREGCPLMACSPASP